MSSKKLQNDYDTRINRLIGQIDGIRKMIHDRRSPYLIGQQIMAAREALSKIGLLIAKDAIIKSKSSPEKENLLKQIFRI